MVFAHQKYLSGAAEYLLFMWQMEDLVRAVNFDIDALDGFITTLTQDESQQQEERPDASRHVQLARKSCLCDATLGAVCPCPCVCVQAPWTHCCAASRAQRT